MATEWAVEYTVEAGTASATDVVLTLPTRHHYVTAEASSAPFSSTEGWSPNCGGSGASPPSGGEVLGRLAFDRETVRPFCASEGFPSLPCPGNMARICAASGVASLHPPQNPPPHASSTVLGSTNLGLTGADGAFAAQGQAGWIAMYSAGVGAISLGLGSLPDSTRINLDTGEVVTGRHTFFGLPVVGFFARTFNNGYLSCAGAICQGTYGSAFPIRPARGLDLYP
jgi:hypothetical protein